MSEMCSSESRVTLHLFLCAKVPFVVLDCLCELSLLSDGNSAAITDSICHHSFSSPKTLILFVPHHTLHYIKLSHVYSTTRRNVLHFCSVVTLRFIDL